MPDPMPSPVVDVHAHGVPAPLAAAIADADFLRVEDTPGGMVATWPDGARTLPIGPDLVDLELRIARLDRRGVDVQLLAPFMDVLGYQLPGAAGADWSRLVNDELAAEAARRPDRLRAVGTLPLQAPELAVAEADRVVRDLGMAGIQVGSRVGETELDDPALEPVWATLAELGTVVVLHPLGKLCTPGMAEHGLAHLVGRPTETTTAVSRMLLSGVLTRHPGLRIVVVHGGGFLPLQVGRVAKAVAADAARRERFWADYGQLWFDTVVNDPRALAGLVAMVGPDRVVLGTDDPFALGDDDPVATVTAAGLGAADRAALLGGNAARLLAR